MARGQTRRLALRAPMLAALLAGLLAAGPVAGEAPVAAGTIEPDLAAAAERKMAPMLCGSLS